MTAWIADALILLGLVVMTVGIHGVLWLPDVYTRMHAASKAAFIGVVALLAAACLGGGWAVIGRVVLIVALLVLTTPVAAHAVLQAAWHRREPMRVPGAVDESGTIHRDAPPPPDRPERTS